MNELNLVLSKGNLQNNLDYDEIEDELGPG